MSENLQGEPAFNRWVTHLIEKRERIILLVKKQSARYLKKTHKVGVRLPKSVDEDYKIDAQNGNVLWTNSISKEMTDIKVALKALEDGENVPTGYAYVFCHMIFDVKMEGFSWKVQLVSGGHMTETAYNMTYDSVVSRNTVRLALVIAALNGLEVK